MDKSSVTNILVKIVNNPSTAKNSAAGGKMEFFLYISNQTKFIKTILEACNSLGEIVHSTRVEVTLKIM